MAREPARVRVGLGGDGGGGHMVGYELKLKVTNAARHGATAVVEEWFKSGSRDPDATDLFGQGLLYLAAFHGQRDVVRILLARGASVGASNGADGATALHGAAVHGCCDVAVLLLDAGARVDARDACGNTPLLRAALDDRRDMIRLLLARGAVLDVCGAHGRDAEAFAYRYGHQETALYLTRIRLAGGWRRYVRAPRERLVMLRILAEQGRARTSDPLLERLFPSAPLRADAQAVKRALREALADQPADALARNLDADDAFAAALASALAAPPPREAYRAASGGRLPRGIFWLIFSFWRSARDA